MPHRPINVTEPFLPPLQEYVEYLKGIWERNWLTNAGPLVCELEEKLSAYDRIDMPIHCVANGGLGLQIILKALGIRGEIVTTPFTYVATASCPLWEGCSVRFADIEPDYLTIDPAAVEAAITPQTEAILGTHVFGNPCDCEALEEIARKHGLALIYDAAHAFGVRYKGKSILEYGDASMVSLHATKLFHTVEGGFVVAKDPQVAEKVEWMRRFGHNGYEAFHGVGINAKMSELHAAVGLCNLKYLERVIEARSKACSHYDSAIENNEMVQHLTIREGTGWNYSYYPVLFENTSLLLDSIGRMEQQGIRPRRYFYPSLEVLCDSPDLSQATCVRNAVERILCLPLSSQMANEDVERVASCLQ